MRVAVARCLKPLRLPLIGYPYLFELRVARYGAAVAGTSWFSAARTCDVAEGRREYVGSRTLPARLPVWTTGSTGAVSVVISGKRAQSQLPSVGSPPLGKHPACLSLYDQIIARVLPGTCTVRLCALRDVDLPGAGTCRDPPGTTRERVPVGR